MKNALFLIIVLAFVGTSCGVFSSLTSRTTIGANESFVLGNNPHGSYSVKLRNASKQPLTITQTQLDGTVISTTTAPYNEWLSLSVAKNTAIRIGNKSDKKADVDLKVVGDTNLSMGYQN
jgi:hypothetical protein